MSRENNRLLLELDKRRREINRETINPSLSKLDVRMLEPLVKVCAKARANYVEYLMALANDQTKGAPTQSQIDQLKQFRTTYEELVSAANALETVIERGYVDARERPL